MQIYGKTLNDNRFFPIFFNFALKINSIMKYLVAKFIVNPKTEDVCDLIAWAAGEAGFESFEETPDGLNGYIQQQLYDEDLLKSCLQDIVFDGLSYSFEVSEMEDRNWNETWEDIGFEPITIGSQCIIFDAKHIPDDKDDFDMPIQIDARQAFGTGTHETTRMIVQQMLSMNVSEMDVLDCGCGTGILSIAASKLGARSVFAYDIDAWSVRNTELNAKTNDVHNITAAEGDASIIAGHEQKYDLVLANINRNILLNDMPVFASAMRHGAKLILSGFYSADAGMLISKAGQLGMKCLKQTSDNDWTMLVMEL